MTSRLFDSIRVKPTKSSAPKDAPPCDHAGCKEPGLHKAPKGRNREGEYFNLCIKHVQEYNKGYNYFNGMDDDKVREYQKDALTGHRPTWTMGVKSKAADGPTYVDPFDILKRTGRTRGAARAAKPEPKRPVVGNAARKALDTLGLEETAEKAEVRAKYKQLVKQLHPDVNGGDRSNEDRMRAVIDAYNYLKGAGFV
ncbi:MAG: J domain-containing protein [Beijerinckiaceae bacterium]|nr:J domain-containing protein [Beijerinckiaceae bacterium]